MTDPVVGGEVLSFPRRHRGRVPWQETLADAQHHLTRSSDALEAYISQASSMSDRTDDAKPKVATVRKALVGGLLALATILLLFAIGDQSLLTTTAPAIVAAVALMSLVMVRRHYRHERECADRDVESAARVDARMYRVYRELQAEIFRRWSGGEFDDPAALGYAKDRALDAILNAEVHRLEHVCKRPISLVAIEDTGTEFIAKRSYGSVGSRITFGMRCPHDTSLVSVLGHYAPFHYVAEFHAAGASYCLVALSDVALTPPVQSLIEGAAARYQGSYQFFRLVEMNTPPSDSEFFKWVEMITPPTNTRLEA
jgi:hypothetical protein